MANGIPTYEQFRRSLAGTPMAGEAQGIYNAAIRGGLNPAFVSGLASAESSYGTSGYAVGTHNPYGLGVHLGWKFPNYAKATAKLASTLNSLGYPDLYKKKGISGVIGQYTPYGDASNDPMAHSRNIISAGRKAGGNASVVYVNRGAVPPAMLTAPSGSTPAGVQAPAPTGRTSSSNELGTMLLRQYQMSREGTLTPEVARGNTLALARAIGSSMSGSTTSPSGAVSGVTPPVYSGPVNTDYGSVRGVARPLPTPMGSGDYGYSDPEGQSGRHLADDWFAPANTPLASPVSGTVFRVKGDKNPGKAADSGAQVFGGSVYMRDTANRVWVFRHVDNPQRYTQAGARVSAGQRIGAVKQWGSSPHTHIELYKPGPYEYSSARAMDPNAFFRKAGIK